MEQNDCAIYLNYAIVLANRGYPQLAKELFHMSEQIYDELDDNVKEPEMESHREILMNALAIGD